MEKQQVSRGYCRNRSDLDCIQCTLKEQLMCHFHSRSLLIFSIGFLIPAIPAIVGLLVGGFGLWLLIWFAFMVFFLQVWENRVLCSHCPAYAGEGRTLQCHANYGLLKLWKYQPGPMSRSEQAQFIIGVLIFVTLPLPFLFISQQFLFLAITAIGIAIFFTLLGGLLCPKCLNFSCPLNRVPKDVVDAFLIRNPTMRKAWEEKGYRIESESDTK